MWIQSVTVDAARGLLRRIYDDAITRAGRVYGVVASMSLNPRVLKSSLQLYRDVMFGPSPLSRSQRELIATAVSRYNDCHY